MVAVVISLRSGVPLLVRKTTSLRASRMSSSRGRPLRSGGSAAKGAEGPAGSALPKRQLRRFCASRSSSRVKPSACTWRSTTSPRSRGSRSSTAVALSRVAICGALPPSMLARRAPRMMTVVVRPGRMFSDSMVTARPSAAVARAAAREARSMRGRKTTMASSASSGRPSTTPRVIFARRLMRNGVPGGFAALLGVLLSASAT